MKKTDNAHLDTKLHLRRYFLTRWNAETPIKVLDCFEGSQQIWGNLKKEYKVAQYFGCDLKPAKGRLKIDSEKLLERPGADYNVLDLDSYGSPWKHFLNFTRTGPKEVSVFLTLATIRMGGGGVIGKAAWHVISPWLSQQKIPQSLGGQIIEEIVPFALGHAVRQGWKILEAKEAFPQLNARYIGLRMQRIEL